MNINEFLKGCDAILNPKVDEVITICHPEAPSFNLSIFHASYWFNNGDRCIFALFEVDDKYYDNEYEQIYCGDF